MYVGCEKKKTKFLKNCWLAVNSRELESSSYLTQQC